jgi:TonB-linked SusC/RagA family outer membrane protein
MAKVTVFFGIKQKFIPTVALYAFLTLLPAFLRAQVREAKDTVKVSVIKGETIEKEVSGNTQDAIKGRATGVTDDEGRLLIRGQNTVDGRLALPLFVIDGVQISSDYILQGGNPLQMLNATNIEKIEILRNAEETAIYGGKGSNGVVKITTKQGDRKKQGAGSFLQVDGRFSVGLTQPSQWYDFLNTEEYIDIRTKAFEADGITPTNTNAYDLLIWGNEHYHDWQKEFLRKNTTNYSALLNIQGGTPGATTFYLSGDYNDFGNVYLAEDDDRQRRFNTRLLVNHVALNKRLNINASLSYSATTSKEKGVSPGDESSYLVYAPNQPLYNDDGTLYWYEGSTSVSNPLRFKYADAHKRYDALIGAGQVSFRFTDDLETVIDLGYSRNTSDEYLTIGQDYLNPFASNSYRNRLTAGDSHFELFSIEPRLHYVRPIGKGTLSALLGLSYIVQNSASDAFELRDFPTESMFKNYASAVTKYSVTNSSADKRTASIWTRIGYDFNNRWLLNATWRRDGTSIFERGKRYGNFGAIGGGWLFAHESWVRDNLPFLNYGKLRGSWGVTGNDNVASFLYLNAYSVSSYPYEGNSGMYLSTVANPDFSWESTRKTELALELAMFNNRLQFNAAAYRNVSGNLILTVPLGRQTGLDQYMDNIKEASIRNQGLEFEVAAPLTFGKFDWITSLTLTVPQNNTITRWDGLENTSNATTYQVGSSMNITRLYKFTGINPENGVPEVEDTNQDGSITSTLDKQFMQDTDPDYYGGLATTLRYRGFQFDAFFYFERRPWVKGVLENYYYPLGYQGRNTLREWATDYWTPDNPNASRPGLTTTTSSDIGYAYYYYYTESSAVYTDGSYIRLKNVSLSYSLPETLLRKRGVKALTIFVIGENLLTYTSSNQWDPETGRSVPPMRTITGGVKFRF